VHENGTVYVTTGKGWLHAVSATGTPKWKRQLGDESIGSPTVTPQGQVYAGSDDGKEYALGPFGQPQWTFQTVGRIRSSVATGIDGTPYVGCYTDQQQGAKFYAITPTGQQAWSADVRSVMSSAAIDNLGRIYVGTAAPEKQGSVIALSSSGELLWQHETATGVFASP